MLGIISVAFIDYKYELYDRILPAQFKATRNIQISFSHITELSSLASSFFAKMVNSFLYQEFFVYLPSVHG